MINNLETAAPPKVLNRRLIAWSVGGVLIAIVAALVAWRITHALTAKPDTAVSAIPTVSVTEVGVSEVPSTVSIIGTIAARYDMPIGVEGDGGRVTAVYVEAGDHVKQGQVLAHLKIRCSNRRSRICRLRSIKRARGRTAKAEYQRARAVGASGALSAEETQRRKSRCGDAAAHVKVAAAHAERRQARLARADVRAPADGIILTRNAEVGQTAMPGGEALFRLSKDGETELRGQVAEQDLPLLKVGQLVNVN